MPSWLRHHHRTTHSDVFTDFLYQRHTCFFQLARHQFSNVGLLGGNQLGNNLVSEVVEVGIIESDTVGAYLHSNGKIGCVVALKGGSEELAKDIAMHVTASNPRVTHPDEMPEDVLEKEKEIIKAQPDMAGKPAEIVEKMMGGRIKKFLKENSLVEQPFVKNPDVTIGQLAKDAGAEVIGFIRMEVGEGIEVEHVDFAAEVAAQLKG